MANVAESDLPEARNQWTEALHDAIEADAAELKAGEAMVTICSALESELSEMEPEDRARAGIFQAFQYPVEIPGVTNNYFLKASLNAIREARDCAFATRPAREPREAAAEVPPWARNPRAR